MKPWSEEARLMWGKTDPYAGSWMPLVQHLEDTSAVAGRLWDLWLSRKVTDRLVQHFGDAQLARTVACFLAGVHDIGKAAPDFQCKVSRVPGYGFLIDRLIQGGFGFPPPMGPLKPHGLMGDVIVRRQLITAGVPKFAAPSVSGIVGAHHGVAPSSVDVQRAEGSAAIGTGLWVSVQEEIWTGIAARAGLIHGLHTTFGAPLPGWAQIQLNAIVVVSDWIASNIELFPHITTPGTDSAQEDRLDHAFGMLDLPERWEPADTGAPVEALLAEHFPRLAGASPKPLQMAAVHAARTISAPGLLILEAPMGNGKTEAALLAAHVLAARFGVGGVLVAMPTMATSNPMFTRVAEWLSGLEGTGRTTLNLVHSKAHLNEDYRTLVDSSARYAGIEDETSSIRSQVYVSSWFQGRRKAVLATHVVATIDQFLFGALGAKHVMLRQFALANKVVVIDEVHAADDFMRVYLERALNWMGAHRVPVILLSATLPPGQRQSLAKAYATGFGGRSSAPVPDSLSYPRLTTATTAVEDWPIPTAGTHVNTETVKLLPLVDGPVDLITLLQGEMTGGGCVAIICSTVARAQERFKHLREAGLGEVRLFHSKFLAPHRAQRESDLVRLLGPSGERPERLIVVGTQVLEQSLDIDFDLMISDIAPMDLLLQRIGRLHRHTRVGRPPNMQTPRCYVTGVSDWTTSPPGLDKGGEGIYGSWRLLSTLATLGPLPTTVRIPDDIPRLVSISYDEARAEPDGWSPWDADLEALRAKRTARGTNADAFAIASPKSFLGLDSLTEQRGSDPEAPRGAGRARVRDADESVEVIVIWRDASGNPRLLPEIGPHSGALLPRPLGANDQDLARAAASSSITLPFTLTADPVRLDAVITDLERPALDLSAWQSNHWLAGELFLVLDETGSATVDGVTLVYDNSIGLRIKQP